jgi:hypothetical protein
VKRIQIPDFDVPFAQLKGWMTVIGAIKASDIATGWRAENRNLSSQGLMQSGW